MLFSITKDEFYALNKLYHDGPAVLSDDIAEPLLDKKLIDYREESYGIGYPVFSDDYIITAAGKLAYENYLEYHQELKNASLRSWIAIAISCAALVLTFLDMFIW